MSKYLSSDVKKIKNWMRNFETVKQLQESGTFQEIGNNQNADMGNFLKQSKFSIKLSKGYLCWSPESISLFRKFKHPIASSCKGWAANVFHTKQSTCHNYILDFFDKQCKKLVDHNMSIEKTEKHISKIEELKTRYRRLYTDLESLFKIKMYINNLRQS